MQLPAALALNSCIDIRSHREAALDERCEGPIAASRIRRTVAANLFKAMLLCDAHVPGRSQMEDLNLALVRHGATLPATFEERTWKAWLDIESTQIPGAGSISKLDDAVRSLLPKGLEHCFECMLHFGLLDVMCSRTRRTGDTSLLLARAQEYRPLTPLHLHLDAIETVGWTTDSLGFSARAIRRMAATWILQCVHSHWNPRTGRSYSMGGARARKSAFLRRVDHWPDWNVLGVDEDVSVEQVHRVMVAVASTTVLDNDEDLFTRWIFDCASTFLATHALNWPNHTVMLGHRVTPELSSLALLHAAFIDEDESRHEDERQIARCVPRSAEWDVSAVKVRLMEGWKRYGEYLYSFGLSRQVVREQLENLELGDPMQLVG